MVAAAVVFAYLAVALYIGIFAFRQSRGAADAEDYFLAGRSLGPAVFLLSLFGANMTAFSILGASGHAFANGIVTFGLMASSSALVIPVTLFAIGTRLWALGRRNGFMTPVQMFRDRWECAHIGTVIFAVQAVLLVPYIIIAVMGGGTTLAAVSNGRVPYWLGGAIVSLVIMTYVFFGGMRGTAWVNTFQTILFLTFGAVAVSVISAAMGGFSQAMESLLAAPSTAALLSRERVSPLYFFSYTFIPLSSIAFPHICIFCLTARKLNYFKKTVILYPICMLLIWLPSVFLGVAANAAKDVPAIEAKLEARTALAAAGPSVPVEERDRLRRTAAGDDVILRLVEGYAPLWLASLLAACVMAAVMASDSQILALSTMFTEDVFAFYGGKARFGEAVQVFTGRLFVVLIAVVAYLIALRVPQSIFDVATQYAFAGYAALSPLLVAALFWRRSTKWGALASTVWTALAVLAVAWIQQSIPPPPPGVAVPVWSAFGLDIVTRAVQGALVFGLLPVVPMTIVSALLMFVVSRLTPGARPSERTLARYQVMKTNPRYAGVYLHGDVVILHAMGERPHNSGLISLPPIVRLPTSAAAAEVGRVLREMLDAFQRDVEWSKAARDEFLKATGFTSWKQLEGPARCCWIREEAGEIVFTPLRNGGSRGDEKGFQPFGADDVRCQVRGEDAEVGAALLAALAASR